MGLNSILALSCDFKFDSFDTRMAAWRAEATDEGADVLRWVDRMLIR